MSLVGAVVAVLWVMSYCLLQQEGQPQDSLSPDMLEWDFVSRGMKQLSHTWKSPRTSVSSGALPHSTNSVEKLQ